MSISMTWICVVRYMGRAHCKRTTLGEGGPSGFNSQLNINIRSLSVVMIVSPKEVGGGREGTRMGSMT